MNKFKIGDTVRMKDIAWNRESKHYNNMIGQTFTVSDIHGPLISVNPRGRASFEGMLEDRFELVPPGEIYTVLRKDENKLNSVYYYTTAEEAKTTAISLAFDHPGQEFFIFKAVGRAQSKAPTFESFCDGEG